MGHGSSYTVGTQWVGLVRSKGVWVWSGWLENLSCPKGYIILRIINVPNVIKLIYLYENVTCSEFSLYEDVILDACCQNIASNDDIWNMWLV
ncbi:hypothetical protein HanPSC8_Chr03g0118791 [Helianthus annuus]|nr:hypothetical protein HanPSC8_Chr03g0118791 [Helianthus annuus]